MKDREVLNTQDFLIEVYLSVSEPQRLSHLGSRCDNKPEIIGGITQMCNNLSSEEKYQLLKLLQKYECLFDETFMFVYTS
jgi:hypothetical protein